MHLNRCGQVLSANKKILVDIYRALRLKVLAHSIEIIWLYLAMKIGLIADIHGDLAGFRAALRLLEDKGVEHILCAGDIVDRGPDADTVVQLLQEHNVA